MNILFPTNFSEQSINAFQFALEYAYRMKQNIVVFHAYNENSIPDDLKSIYQEVNIENYKEKKLPFPNFQKLVTGIYQEVNVKYVVEKGSFIDTITDYVDRKEDEIDAIIMGTDDKERFLEIFVEAKTLKVIDNVNKPVIAVPLETDFDGRLDNLLFLVDYKETEKAPLISLINKVKEFNAKLHIVHLDVAHGESIVPLMDEFKNTLDEEGLNNVEFVTIDAIDFKTALQEYCEDYSIDMICVMNHERNYYQRLFTQSLAEYLIKNVNKPIMAIYHK